MAIILARTVLMKKRKRLHHGGTEDTEEAKRKKQKSEVRSERKDTLTAKGAKDAKGKRLRDWKSLSWRSWRSWRFKFLMFASGFRGTVAMAHGKPDLKTARGVYSRETFAACSNGKRSETA